MVCVQTCSSFASSAIPGILIISYSTSTRPSAVKIEP